jgi:hypothetical protein
MLVRHHSRRQVLGVGVDRVAKQHQLHDRHADHHREGQPVALELHQFLQEHRHDPRRRQRGPAQRRLPRVS